MKIGAQIKKYRARSSLSQLDLALAIGYKNQADVSRIERDEQWPDGVRLTAIAKALGCAVSDFFIDAEYEYSDDIDANGWKPRVGEPSAAYVIGDDEPTIDRALDVASQQLPPVDLRTQAILAVEIYKASIAKQSADRIVSAINSLTMAVEQARDR